MKAAARAVGNCVNLRESALIGAGWPELAHIGPYWPILARSGAGTGVARRGKEKGGEPCAVGPSCLPMPAFWPPHKPVGRVT